MSESKFEEWARELDASGDFRVLRRLRERSIVSRRHQANEKMAIAVDTETTGLDVLRDEAIEIAMIAFIYDSFGNIGDVIGVFNALRQPGVSF